MLLNLNLLGLIPASIKMNPIRAARRRLRAELQAPRLRHRRPRRCAAEVPMEPREPRQLQREKQSIVYPVLSGGLWHEIQTRDNSRLGDEG